MEEFPKVKLMPNLPSVVLVAVVLFGWLIVSALLATVDTVDSSSGTVSAEVLPVHKINYGRNLKVCLSKQTEPVVYFIILSTSIPYLYNDH